jgi:biopolymer transport protein ExbB/TolQ
MIWNLLLESGGFALLLGPLLIAAVLLLLLRLHYRALARQLLTTATATLRAVDQLVHTHQQQPAREMASGRQRSWREQLRSEVGAVDLDLAQAIERSPAEFAAELLPRLAPVDPASHRNDAQLELVANLAPALGLCGTVAGIANLFATIARTGLSNGLADLGEPGRMAMATTLLGIPALAIALMALGLIGLDPERAALRELLVRWHSRVHRLLPATPGSTASPPIEIPPLAQEGDADAHPAAASSPPAATANVADTRSIEGEP